MGVLSMDCLDLVNRMAADDCVQHGVLGASPVTQDGKMARRLDSCQGTFLGIARELWSNWGWRSIMVEKTLYQCTY